jgi:hypothetical protein
MMFIKEVNYLIWVFEKKLKLLKGPYTKANKNLEKIIEKLQKVKDPGMGKDYLYFPIPISHEGLDIIKKYQEKMSAEYTLDYSIWQFVNLEYKRRNIEDNFKGRNVY